MLSNQNNFKKFLRSSVALVVFYALADPSFAQSEKLKELSRSLLGSSFDDNKLQVAPLGVIDQNTGRIQTVVNDIVDDNAVILPYFHKQFGKSTGHIVELLIPIKTGLEFSLLQAKYPEIKVQQSPNGVSILAASSKNALPMYFLGRKIQEEFGYSFELAYSDGHPDLNLAWLAPHSPRLFALKKQSLKVAQSVNTLVTPTLSSNASDLGDPLSWSVPSNLNKKIPSKTIANRLQPVEVEEVKQPIANRLQPVEVEEVKQPTVFAIQHVSSNFPRLISPPPVNLSNKNKLASKLVGELNSNSFESSKSTFRPSILAGLPKKKNLIAAVGISPVHLKNIHIGSSNLIAINKRLNYVYVEVANSSDIDKLNNSSGPVNVLRRNNNMLLARVGIYSNTKIGNRLKETKLSQLQSAGFNIIANNASIV